MFNDCVCVCVWVDGREGDEDSGEGNDDVGDCQDQPTGSVSA